ncbi:hypothetical protein J2W58_001810 [Pseudomonas psychrotolerans]|nr:hypothetical protein [Pseudomonas psychrotolerans]
MKRFHYDDHMQLQQHLAHFIDAYNFGRRLKALKGLTPYEFICKQWAAEPQRFRIDPIHQMPGLYSLRIPLQAGAAPTVRETKGKGAEQAGGLKR